MAIEQAAPEMMGGIQPLIDLVQPFFVKASIVVGGIFGIYLILLVVRVHYERKKVKILQDIRYDLDKLNNHHGIKSSRNRKGFFRRMISSLKKKSRDKKIEKKFVVEEKNPKKKGKKK